MKFLLYGANGYTGKLIIRFAKEYGITPILAGRTEAKIKPLAEESGYEYRVIDLFNKEQLDSALKEVPVVLHAAGPFKFTARPMMEACLRTGTHYLDITGEIEVFEMAAAMTEKAEAAKIMIMPGVGFDVVPTDCMAKYLKDLMPNATHLQLAFGSHGGGGWSQGSAKTMVENLGGGGAERKDGEIITVPAAHRTVTVPHPVKSFLGVSIPWGDVSTSFYSTGIPNIVTYTKMEPKQVKAIKMQKYLGWLFRSNFFKSRALKKIESGPAGPTDEMRAKTKMLIWGEVKNANGDTRQAALTTPEGYTLTARAGLLITKKILNGSAPIGFQTPAKAYGAGLVLEMDGVSRQDI